MSALIFDFDGVIADSEAIANTVLAEVVTDLGHSTTLDKALTRYSGRRWDEVVAEIEAVLCLSVLALETEFGSHVFSADMVARGKPHPDIFLFAAGKLGVSPDQCLVIEDSAGGIRAAIAAGMTAVGLCAASHIREGHDLKLRDAGAVHVAHSWLDVEHFALRFFKY